MKNKVLVVFAMKEEFASWRSRHRFQRIASSPCPVWKATIGNTNAYATLVGAGAPDARCVADLATSLVPSLAIVTGVAAGLKPQWRPGDVLAAESVSDHGSSDGKGSIIAAPHLIDIAVECGAKRVLNLITVPRVLRTVQEKLQLSRFGDAADMESLLVLQAWTGIPSLAVRVIVDPVEMPMSCDFEATFDAHGQLSLAKLLGQLARHPSTLPNFFELAGRSRSALGNLARFLDRFFEHLDRHYTLAANSQVSSPSPRPAP